MEERNTFLQKDGQKVVPTKNFSCERKLLFLCIYTSTRFPTVSNPYSIDQPIHVCIKSANFEISMSLCEWVSISKNAN